MHDTWHRWKENCKTLIPIDSLLFVKLTSFSRIVTLDKLKYTVPDPRSVKMNISPLSTRFKIKCLKLHKMCSYFVLGLFGKDLVKKVLLQIPSLYRCNALWSTAVPCIYWLKLAANFHISPIQNKIVALRRVMVCGYRRLVLNGDFHRISEETGTTENTSETSVTHQSVPVTALTIGDDTLRTNNPEYQSWRRDLSEYDGKMRQAHLNPLHVHDDIMPRRMMPVFKFSPGSSYVQSWHKKYNVKPPCGTARRTYQLLVSYVFTKFRTACG